MPDRADAIAAGLSDDVLNWHGTGWPKDRWSIAQCLDHLNRANGKIAPQLEAGIEKAKSDGKASTGPWKPGMLERFFIRMVGPNAPLPAPVPPDFLPADRISRDEILAKFAALHDRFLASLDEVERSGLVRVKVSSPVSKLIKCSLGGWFEATIEHGLYHLGQAETVRKELDAQRVRTA